MAILLNLVWIAQLVCLILVLIKMFQDNKIVLGIISIFCGLVAFVYGWMNADRYRIRNVMMIWTALILLAIVLSFFVYRRTTVIAV